MKFHYKILLIITLSLFCFFHLVNYPFVWYDDACHYLPVKNLAERGEISFPIDSQKEFNPSSLFITVGPVLNYPTAFFMKIFGTGMLQARTVVSFFLLFTILLFYKISKLLLDERKAIWATLLFAGSIQLWTFGRMYIGEVPMLFFTILGFYFQIYGLRKSRVKYFFLAVFSFSLAINVKEYIAAPIALVLGIYFLFSLQNKTNISKWLLIELFILPLMSIIYYLLRFQSIDALKEYFTMKAAYRIEFLDFGFRTPLLFLLKKPLILLGFISLAVKVYFRRDKTDFLLFIFFIICFLFFLVSKGFERFGFLLNWIPAIYFSEFVGKIWERISLFFSVKKFIYRFIFVIIFTLFFYQRTPMFFYKMFLYQKDSRTEITDYLKGNSLSSAKIFTPELDIIPFLPENVNYLLPKYPPAFYASGKYKMYADAADSLRLLQADALIRGSYGRTEYQMIYPEEFIMRYFEAKDTINDFIIYLRK